MDDLRRRFETLDAVEVPDLWDEVQRRSVLNGGERTETVPIHAGRPRIRGDRPGGMLGLGTPVRIALLLAALLVAALAVYLVGSSILERDLTVRPPSTPAVSVPVPSGPTPDASPALPITIAKPLDCETAQRLVRTPANGWAAGPAPDPIAMSRPATIATWATDSAQDGRPLVTLIDPLTGVTCPLEISFSPDQTIERIAWSPDGNALAISTYELIPQGGGSRARLAVLSPLGLYRGGVAGDVAWSPDGSRLAVTYTSHSPSPGAATVWIVDRDGSQRQLEFNCDPCYASYPRGRAAGATFWSPDSSSFAFAYAQYAIDSPSGGHLVAERTLVASAGSVSVSILDQAGIQSWIDDRTLAQVDEAGQTFALPVDRPDQRHPATFVPPRDGQSPDGRYVARLVVRNETTGAGDLVVDDLVTGGSTTVTSDRESSGQWIWSPDSSMIAYAESPEPTKGPRPGIWIVNVDGTGARRLTDAVAADGGIAVLMPTAWQPVWSAGP